MFELLSSIENSCEGLQNVYVLMDCSKGAGLLAKQVQMGFGEIVQILSVMVSLPTLSSVSSVPEHQSTHVKHV
jgi:hypothetical protein